MSELFLTLFNHSVAAGWLVLAILALRLLLRRAPRRIHCALWGLVGLRLVWPFSLPSPVSLLPSAQPVPPEILYDPAPTVETGVDSFNAVVNPFLTQHMTPNLGDSVNPLQVYTYIAANLWLLGLIALLLYTLVSYLRLRRRLAESVPLAEGIRCAPGIETPFILGIFRPTIYLPFTMDDERCGAVLAHERTHLRRRDHWWRPLSWLIVCVFWFHPLLWLAWILLGRDMELACDEQVIGEMDADHKKDYARALLSCSASRHAVCPLAFGEVGVKQRIRAVLDYRKPAAWLVTFSLIAAAVLAVCFLTDPAAPDEVDNSLPAVTWRYSPAMSVTWASAFPFDFGTLEYTHIEASCTSGEIWNFDPTAAQRPVRELTLEQGLALSWSPYNQNFTNTTDRATIEVTVYNGLLPLYQGAIHLTCIDRNGLEATYEARMDGDLRLLRDTMTTGARVVTKQQYEEAVSPGSIILSGVDLNHNGRGENIHIHATQNGQFYEFLVVEDGSLLWSTAAHTSHPGWTTLALVERDGQDYLLEYNPSMTMGYAYYSLRLFSLEGGGIHIIETGGVNFVWPTGITQEMQDFAAQAEGLLQNAAVLLSTEQGQAVLGPVPATEVPSIWPPTDFDPDAKG